MGFCFVPAQTFNSPLLVNFKRKKPQVIVFDVAGRKLRLKKQAQKKLSRLVIRIFARKLLRILIRKKPELKKEKGLLLKIELFVYAVILVEL